MLARMCVSFAFYVAVERSTLGKRKCMIQTDFEGKFWIYTGSTRALHVNISIPINLILYSLSDHSFFAFERMVKEVHIQNFVDKSVSFHDNQ